MVCFCAILFCKMFSLCTHVNLRQGRGQEGSINQRTGKYFFVYFLFFTDINYFYPAEAWKSHKQKDLKLF